MRYLMLGALVYLLYVVLRLHWISAAVIGIYLMLMLPVHLRYYKKMKQQKLRFMEGALYLEQLLYSFEKEHKVERTLEMVAGLVPVGELKTCVMDAVEYLHMTYDNVHVMRDSLRVIEQRYPCERIRSAHDFIVHVETYGGKITEPVELLLKDKKRWEQRILASMKERSRRFGDIVLSIAASLVICGMIIYIPVVDMDISGNVIGQCLSVIVLILDDLIFLRAQHYMAVDWLGIDVTMAEGDEKKRRSYESYDAKRERRLSILLTLPCVAGFIWALASGHRFLSVGFVFLCIFMMNQHEVGHTLARRSLVRSMKCAFPKWLMDMVLLLQSENVHMAMVRSREHVPPVMSLDLERMIGQLELAPESADPFHGFMRAFAIPEVYSAMSMLYAISTGSSRGAGQQLGDLIDRNLEMLDLTERERISNMESGMYLLFLAPVITASMKLLVDMAIFMLTFFAAAGV